MLLLFTANVSRGRRRGMGRGRGRGRSRGRGRVTGQCFVMHWLFAGFSCLLGAGCNVAMCVNVYTKYVSAVVHCVSVGNYASKSA